MKTKHISVIFSDRVGFVSVIKDINEQFDLKETTIKSFRTGLIEMSAEVPEDFNGFDFTLYKCEVLKSVKIIFSLKGGEL